MALQNSSEQTYSIDPNKNLEASIIHTAAIKAQYLEPQHLKDPNIFEDVLQLMSTLETLLRGEKIKHGQQ